MTAPKHPWHPLEEALNMIESRFPISAETAGGVMLSAIIDGRVGIRGLSSTVKRQRIDALIAIRFAQRSNYQPTRQMYLRNAKNPPLRHLSFDESFDLVHEGYLLCTPPNAPEDWQIISDIEVRGRDLSTFMNGEFYWPQSGQEGRSRREDHWLAITVALLRLSRLAELHNGNFSDDMALRDEVLKMTSDGLDERSIRFDLKVIHELFVHGAEGPNRIRKDVDSKFDVYEEIRGARSRLISRTQKS